MATHAAAAASGAKRKRGSDPVSPPSDSSAKRRAQSGAAAASVSVEGKWADFMQPARDAGKFLDITLLVGGRKIKAHKAVLISLSPYLDGLLTSGLAESVETGHEMTVGDETTDGTAVEAIVDLMYSGELTLSASTVGSVIRTANLLQVGAAEKAACDYFVKSLEPCTACEALAFAASFAECGAHARELHERCAAYVVEHFEECGGEAAFLELPIEAVAGLIASDDLPCEEAVVVAAVRAWFEHDYAGRASALKSLVPLIRWPLLPVAAQLQFSTEPLLVRLIKQDDGCLALGMNLLLECKSAAAAACPRLKRRKGTAVPVLPLGFTAFRQEYYTTSEDGALLTVTEDPDDRSALCGLAVMNSGQSCAEVTVVRVTGETLIGVARPTLDVNATSAYETADFWGLYSEDGDLRHNPTWRNWQGQQPYAAGDVLRLLLDSDAGTLTVKKNGNLLGVAVTEGLTGDLCWAVACGGAGDSLRIRAVDPAEF